MRATLHIMAATLLALSVGGCGNLENAPFRQGTVHGQLTESDPAVALVALVGQPGVRTNVDAEGRFTLERVPAGPVELFIVATADKAARVPVTVQGGQSVDVKAVKPKDAGFLDLRVTATQHERVSGTQVAVVGTPFQRLELDDTGRLRLGPLPDGCYEVTVSVLGFPEVQTAACVGPGERKPLNIELRSEGRNRCAVTGCEDGLVCSPTGRCVECFEDAQCGEGLSCKGFRCEGPGALCAPCDGDWKCRPGATCQELPEGGTACVAACSDSSTCDSGFTCQGGRCLPDAARFESCQALRRLGMDCDGDASCLAQGLMGGMCLDGTCTAPCIQDLDCPSPFRCEATPAGRMCLPIQTP